MLHVPAADAGRGMEPLRDELARRRAQRYRRRWFLRWRHRRLVLRRVVLEIDLASPDDEAMRGVYEREVARIEDRLEKNAARLYR